ncbi:MAG: hypothetical protein KME55_25750 [Nostoc indistinguendum CM1-VF10]|jgi:hypothetical protein|nr:hypothetical protein [Nostoc indistinguendum CM1-VF10]
MRREPMDYGNESAEDGFSQMSEYLTRKNVPNACSPYNALGTNVTLVNVKPSFGYLVGGRV